MKKYNNFKKFENYSGSKMINDDALKDKAKDIINEIINIKKYFIMLRDSTEHVYSKINKIIPTDSRKDEFVDYIKNKDVFLSNLLSDLFDSMDSEKIMLELSDVIQILNNIENYTDDNMDSILNGENKTKDDNDGEDDGDDGDDDDEYEIEEPDFEEVEDFIDVDKLEIEKPKDDSADQHNLMGDQLKRRKKKDDLKESAKIRKSLQKIDDIENFVKKYSKFKKENINVFKKGDTAYIDGISTDLGKKMNGKKVTIVDICEDGDCYNIYDPTISPKKDGSANIKKMPSKFLFKEMPIKKEVIVVDRKRPIAKKKHKD